MTRRLLPLLALPLLLLSTPGCAALQKLLAGAVQAPELTFQRMAVRDPSLGGLTLDVTWKVHNPNAFGLDLAGLAYRFEVEGAQVASGRKQEALTVPAGGEGEVTLPFQVRFADLSQTVQTLLSKRTVAWGLSGDFTFDTPVGPVTVPVSRTGSAPVPRIPRIALSQVRVRSTSLTSADLELQLSVDNPNDFPLPLERLDWTLALAGVEVGSGRTGMPDLAAARQTAVTLPLKVSFAQAGRGVAEALRSGRVAVALEGALDAGPTQLPIDLSGTIPLR